MMVLICIKLFDSLIVFLKESFENVNFEKKSADNNKNIKNYTTCKKLKLLNDLGQIKKIVCFG